MDDDADFDDILISYHDISEILKFSMEFIKTLMVVEVDGEEEKEEEQWFEGRATPIGGVNMVLSPI